VKIFQTAQIFKVRGLKKVAHHLRPPLFKNFFSKLSNKMAKTSSKGKPAAAVTPKKNGDGGRISKPAAKAEKGKTVAKAVVASSKKNGVSKDSKVSIEAIYD
jgi:hypothetical protein